MDPVPSAWQGRFDANHQQTPLVFKHSSRSRGISIPKGPVRIPIVGSLPFLTRYYPELIFDKWAKRFGPLYSVWLGNRLYVIISSAEVAKDILVTRGAVSSSRNSQYIKSQILFAGRGVTSTPYNETWRRHRRIAKQSLSQKALDELTPALNREALEMVNCLLVAGQSGSKLVNAQQFIGRYGINMMLKIVFGIRTESIHDPLVSKILWIGREFMYCAGPFANLVDFVPILQYLPTEVRTRAKIVRQEFVKTYGGIIESMDQRMKKGENVPDCLAKNLLLARVNEKLDDLDIIMLAAVFMTGGAETPSATIQWFTALMPGLPEIQSRAHEELDRVVGRDRLPTLEDEKNLPYCRGIIKEVLRCNNPEVLIPPHVASEDITYNGQLIPKGTTIFLNSWTIHQNDARYPEPETFNPDRYINDSLSFAQSTCLPDPNQRDHWAFGAGRRICPGISVADRAMWLAVSRMLWAFNMEAAPEHPINLKDYDGFAGRSPVPFQIYLKPRHKNVAELLEKASRESVRGLTMH